MLTNPMLLKTCTARLTILIMLLLLFDKAWSKTYYFSESTGDDSRSSNEAQNAATPWRSLNRLNNFATQLTAGDSVLFKRGELFKGNIFAAASGNAGNFITYAAYGQGSKPVISGFGNISAWSTTTGNVREATLSSAIVNILLLNGEVKAKGRYPNASAPGNGFLTIEHVGGQNTFTDDQLPASPDWTGAFAVIRKTRWVLDRDSIVRHAGNIITYSASSGYGAAQGYGYFIQDDLRTLDQEGEWYFNASAKKIYVYTSTNPSQINVQAAAGTHLVQVDHHAYLRFDDLRFEGANMNAFELNNAHQVYIRNCEIAYTGVNAINAENAADIYVEGCGIGYTNNIAVNTNNCSGILIRNNNISCTGTFPGMGQNNSGSYEAIILKGNNNRVEYNSIDSTGYIPITFSGNNVTIKNNFISGFAFVKDDGGGIYTWNNSPGAAREVNRIVTGNIVLNGIGARAGTDDVANARVHGIYIDDNAGDVDITGNTIANCAEYGIFIHNAHDLLVRANTVYNNRVQLVLSHDDIAPNAPVKNIAISNNIFFAKHASQHVAEFRTIDSDVGGFGISDSNYYSRPVDDDLVIYTSYRVNGTYYNALLDLEAWQALYGKDLHSAKSPVRIAAYRINNIGSNQYANGSFNNDIGGLYVYANGGNASASFTTAAGLDNGALKVEFTGQTYVIIGVGGVEANKNYILRFSHKGRGSFKNMQVFLRQSQSPYNDLSERKFRRVTTGRSESEFLLTSAATENDASIVFELEDQSSPIYFDNIQLSESSITITNPGDSIRFEYNASVSAKTVALDGTYIDARKNIYAGSVTLNGYSSAVLIKLAGLYPLALNFLSFRGALAGNGTNLQWTTSADAAAGYYEVERSASGGTFSKIGQVPVKNTGPYVYQFTDVRPLNGSNYYRLQHVQGSGRLYSNIIRVDNNISRKALRDLQNEDMLVIPNPATNIVQVIINALPVTQPAVIKIETVAGQAVKSFSLYLKDNRTTLDITALKPGTYNLRFTCNGKVLVKRFLKIS